MERVFRYNLQLPRTFCRIIAGGFKGLVSLELLYVVLSVSVLCLFQISSLLMLYSDKQMIWSVKSVSCRFSINSSSDLEHCKIIIGSRKTD